MTPERVKKLSDIGFDFDPKETEWNRRYEQYLRYIEEKKYDIYIKENRLRRRASWCVGGDPEKMV